MCIFPARQDQKSRQWPTCVNPIRHRSGGYCAGTTLHWQVLEPASHTLWQGRHVTTWWRCWCRKAGIWSQRSAKALTRHCLRNLKLVLTTSELLPSWAPTLLYWFYLSISFLSLPRQFNPSSQIYEVFLKTFPFWSQTPEQTQRII